MTSGGGLDVIVDRLLPSEATCFFLVVFSLGMSSARDPPGALSFFEYLGAPRSWLTRRPRLPSRNWLIFLGCTSSLTAAYAYDRHQCKKLKQAYVDQVKHLADTPFKPWELPRKVTVLTSKWPGDDDHTRGVIYFKKYVKVRAFHRVSSSKYLIPVFNAAYFNSRSYRL